MKQLTITYNSENITFSKQNSFNHITQQFLLGGGISGFVKLYIERNNNISKHARSNDTFQQHCQILKFSACYKDLDDLYSGEHPATSSLPSKLVSPHLYSCV